MLFNSFEFIFLFLPIVFFGFFFLGKYNHYRLAISWLIVCSLFFYAWWDSAYLALILFSILFNYSFGIIISSKSNNIYKKALLIFGITVNLSLLGYFKYTNFLVDQINLAIGTEYDLDKIVLPLAISFFTFQQIAYLVDTYRKETNEYNFLKYCLFVSFFPQLIAGPIVHHKEMLPQFNSDSIYRINTRYIAIGLTIFSIGLFKKIVLADNVAVYANTIFAAADRGDPISFFEAWIGALSYTFQLYFDFSGYSDMAIGLAYLFGIKLPVNFNSPYKATSIIEFWRRWHITLSSFLRDYLYFTLGGNRSGIVRRYANLLITMLLGGIWHGAGWTFLFWGMLHGFYLIVNHAWRKFRFSVLKWGARYSKKETLFAGAITFLSVVVGWVYFRSGNLDSANSLIYTMIGGNGISLFNADSYYFNLLNMIGIAEYFTFNGIFPNYHYELEGSILWISILALISFLSPNSTKMLSIVEANLDRKIPSIYVYTFSLYISVLFVISISSLIRVSEFLYFNF
jgi:D-alanyl-lipoteichoic acid acyltransferase DltB (MBOAT superfamily)